jgi:hypothetical protein
VERRGAAAARNSISSSSGACIRANIDNLIAAPAAQPGDVAAVRPDSGRDLPLHATLAQVSMPSAAPAAVAGDDLEAEVAELMQAMQKSGSPVESNRSSALSILSSLPSSNSRGSIDRALLLSVVGPACSVNQTSLASPPPPAPAHASQADDIGRAHVSKPSAEETGAGQLTPSTQAAPAMPASGAASEVGLSGAAARPLAPRNALVYKWMLWTGSAYEPFSDAAHDLIEKSLRDFEMRVVIDLGTGGARPDSGSGVKLFVNPVGRTAYFYDDFARKKVCWSPHVMPHSHAIKPGRRGSHPSLQLVHRYRRYVAATSRAQR